MKEPISLGETINEISLETADFAPCHFNCPDCRLANFWHLQCPHHVKGTYRSGGVNLSVALIMLHIFISAFKHKNYAKIYS
jgi:hypothetical protein